MGAIVQWVNGPRYEKVKQKVKISIANSKLNKITTINNVNL